MERPQDKMGFCDICARRVARPTRHGTMMAGGAPFQRSRKGLWWCLFCYDYAPYVWLRIPTKLDGTSREPTEPAQPKALATRRP